MPHADEPTPDSTPVTDQLPAVCPTLSGATTPRATTPRATPPRTTPPPTTALPAVPPAATTRAGRGGRRRTRVAAIVAVTALAAGAGAGAVASAHKTVTLDVHGEVTTVSTFAGSAQGVLNAHDIALGEHDTVSLALDAPLRDGDEIVVRYASEVTVETDGEVETRWVAVLDADEALRELMVRGRDVRLVASRSGDRRELPLPLLADGGRIDVVVDGERHALAYEDTGLPALLAGAGIEVGEDDLVSVVASESLPDLPEPEAVTADDPQDEVAQDEVAQDEVAQDGAALDAAEHPERAAVAVVIQRVVTQEETTTMPLPFGRTERDDPQRFEDLRPRVVQAGAEGLRTIVDLVTRVDGVETERVRVSQDEVAPVEEIVAIGTRARPAPPAPASAVGGDVWARLAQCESGGRPDAVSPGGRFHGLYQFSVATWQSVGGTGLPSQASPAEQRMRAEMLQARSGWGQWPSCARRLGLL